MDYLIHKLFDEKSAKDLAKNISQNSSSWQDGKKTAGSHASQVKNNLQLDRNSKNGIKYADYVSRLISNDPLIKSFALPETIHGIMFSKSLSGQGYGLHIDNPYMSTGRSDLSFTLFLSDENEYDGGELSVQNVQETKKIKLPAGQIFIYPSTSLHSVEKVSKGERIVCVGWIQSYIRSNEERSFLFALDAGAKGLLAKHGRSAELDLIFQSYSNLLRTLGN